MPITQRTVIQIVGQTPVLPFQGNPNTTISSINTSGGIVSSRTSGQTPCFVQVSASGITATGASVIGTVFPYEDLEYTWDFGDASGTENITDPTTNATVNMNTAQSGPEATYCYRTASGTPYTITLTIRGKNGSGYITATVTTSITVSAFTASGGDFFVDFAAAGGGSGTIGSPFNSIAQVNSNVANNTRFSFKRGSSVTGATGIDISNKTLSHIRFQDYGSGALPLITMNGGNAGFFTNNGGGTAHPQDDIVLSNISFQTTTGFDPAVGTVVGSTEAHASATITNLYYDNLSVGNSVDPAVNNINVIDFGGNTKIFSNCGLWKCTVVGFLGTGLTTNCRQGIYAGVPNWLFCVGNSVSGSGHSPATQDHHIYVHVQFHGHFAYNLFGLTATVGHAPTKNFCVKISFNLTEGDGGFYGRYINVSRNYMTGTMLATSLDNGTNDPTQTRWKDAVCQQNSMTALTEDQQLTPFAAETWTVRDNNVWNCLKTWINSAPPSGTIGYLKCQIYRNKIYKTDGTTSGPVFNYDALTYTLPQIMTDNIFYTTNVSADFIGIIFTDMTNAGSFIDRNNYWAPNAGNFLDNNGTPVSLATWKVGGWDTHVNTTTGSNNANPGWSNPASGVF